MNAERDLAPLAPSVVRALNDKLYEKRKVAALEIEKLVREFVAQNNTSQIKHVIQILSQEFALSQHPHSRKGGLIGLAACSIALGKDALPQPLGRPVRSPRTHRMFQTGGWQSRPQHKLGCRGPAAEGKVRPQPVLSALLQRRARLQDT